MYAHSSAANGLHCRAEQGNSQAKERPTWASELSGGIVASRWRSHNSTVPMSTSILVRKLSAADCGTQ
eukprot:7780260-Karenia_brevis.AAC.1